jgi:transposase
MNIEQLFSQALGIVDPWYIKSVNFNSASKKLDIEVDFKKGSVFKDDSPKDNKNSLENTSTSTRTNTNTNISDDLVDLKTYKAYDTIKKTWRHLNFFEHECYLHCRTPRIQTDDGSTKLIMPPWSGVMNGFSLLFEALIMKLVKQMPVNNVANLLKISDDKIWQMLDIYTYGARISESYSDIKTIGIDETSITKGHQYISLFVDLCKKRTIFVSEGKSSQTITDFAVDLKEHNGAPEQIKEVSCDMSPAFIKGVKEVLPEAQITFDKFHILKIINEGVDRVRQEESITNPLLKKTRYIFLKNDTNLTIKEKAKKTELSMPDLNLKSMKAMHIRENFQAIYFAENVSQFEQLLQKWYLWVMESGLEPMIKAAKTIKNHWEGVVRWKTSQINNGILEGLNSVLQATKRKARGYGKKHFQTIAYLMTGKLDFSKVNKYCLPTCF